MKRNINKSVIYCVGFIFYASTSYAELSNTLINNSRAIFYTDIDNMNKYSQLSHVANLYLVFNSMDSITVRINHRDDALEFDSLSLKKYIYENIESRDLVYVLFSKDAYVKYKNNEGISQVITFWENYFADIGFKRLIIQQAHSRKGYNILIDKIIIPINSKSESVSKL